MLDTNYDVQGMIVCFRRKMYNYFDSGKRSVSAGVVQLELGGQGGLLFYFAQVYIFDWNYVREKICTAFNYSIILSKYKGSDINTIICTCKFM